METNDNVLISTDNKARNATVSSYSETQAGHGVENLLSADTYKSARVYYPKTGHVVLSVTFPSRTLISFVALVKTNLSQYSRYVMKFYTAKGGALLLETTEQSVMSTEDTFGTANWGDFSWGGLVSVEGFKHLSLNLVHVLEETLNCGYIEIQIDPKEEGPRYFESFMLWVDRGYQPELNADYGAEIRVLEDTEQKANRAGGRTYGSPIRRRAVSLELPTVHKSEAFRNIMGPIFQESGESKFCFVSLTPKDRDSLIYSSFLGNVINGQKMNYAFWNRMTVPLEIEENP